MPARGLQRLLEDAEDDLRDALALMPEDHLMHSNLRSIVENLRAVLHVVRTEGGS